MTAQVRIRHLRSDAPDFEAEFARLRHWSAATDDAIEQRVAAILADVRARGDAALIEYTAQLDRVQAQSASELELGHDALLVALATITPAQRHALEAAAERVRDFHQRQLEACGRRSIGSASMCRAARRRIRPAC
jgi:histidinol dehydrogenase